MGLIGFTPELKAYTLQTLQALARRDPLGVKGVVRATTRLVENCQSEGEMEGHVVVCDEPPERGGTGQGPAPLSYFVASLGF